MKRPVKSLLSALLLLIAFNVAAAAQGGTQPLTVAEMLKLRRVADPQLSPDGRFIAYRSQVRAGFEADRWRLMLYDRESNTSRELISGFSNFVESFAFSPDGKFVYFTSGERGRHPVYVAPTDTGRAVKILEGFNDDLHLSKDGRTLVFSRTSATAPTEIFKVTLTNPTTADTITQITRTNDVALEKFYLPAAEELTWTGAGGARGEFRAEEDGKHSASWHFVIRLQVVGNSARLKIYY